MEKEKKVDLFLNICFVIVVLISFIRIFFGTELTDEAYYISDAIKIVHGNIPFAYNNVTFGTGFTFLIIPLVFIYELIIPGMEGVFLFTRISYFVFWLTTLLLGFRILRKNYKKNYALLVTMLMVPYTAGPSIFNFSYNTIPCALSYLSALLLFDAIENGCKYKNFRYALIGFLMSLTVLAQPGYAFAVLVFAILIFSRVKEVSEKFKAFFLCALGFVTELLIVFIPIIIKVGLEDLLKGMTNMFYDLGGEAVTNASSQSLLERLLDGINRHKAIIPFLVVVAVLALGVIVFLIVKKKRIAFELWAVLLSLCIAGFRMIGVDYGCWRIGFLSSIFCVLLIICGKAKKHPILLYLSIYPILFSAGEMIAFNSKAFLSRFTAAVPTLVCFFLVVLEDNKGKARKVNYVSVAVCILALIIGKYSYVYRDESIPLLNTRVDSGVYKGIMTTKARAKDLPECERYLNSFIKEGDRYTARDNVPTAYLMIHNGEMLDIRTWDSLQYSYGGNNPRDLYSYYERRKAIPDKFVYLNFGRDEIMSIELQDFKFNDFIDSYYSKIDDFEMNSTFSHVMTFEYSGDFDGNYEYWIDRE